MSKHSKRTPPAGHPKALPGQLASKEACAAIRKDLKARCSARGLLLGDVQLTEANSIDGGHITIRAGSLRYNIVTHIQKSATVGQALSGLVYGEPNSKHCQSKGTSYKITFVDVGFALANRFVSAKI